MPFITIFLSLFWLTFLVLFSGFAVGNWRERQHRAAILAGCLSLLGMIIGILVFFTPPIWQLSIFIAISSILIISIVLFLLPIPGYVSPKPSPMPKSQVDERTIMFARARLEPGTPQYDAYYKDHPEQLPLDNAFRENPGLLEPGATFYDSLLATSPLGSFILTEKLRDAVDGPIAPSTITEPPEKL